ncbi:MAG: nuclear transport factor 2 family protein [Chloroflexi bacterium]|nr:nuclear transport factor 2 family protein [Chloroflexota bacterium]
MNIADRLAILDVIGKYAYTWDRKDVDGWLQLFMDDGVWEAYQPGTTEPVVRIVSQPELRTYAEQSFTVRLAAVQTRHHQTDTVFVEIGPDRAMTETMVLVTHQGAADAVPRLFLTGVYRDEWRKTEGGWQFARRALYRDSTPRY